MKKLMILALGLVFVLSTVSIPTEAASGKDPRTKHAKHTKRAKRARKSPKKTTL